MSSFKLTALLGWVAVFVSAFLTYYFGAPTEVVVGATGAAGQGEPASSEVMLVARGFPAFVLLSATVMFIAVVCDEVISSVILAILAVCQTIALLFFGGADLDLGGVVLLVGLGVAGYGAYRQHVLLVKQT